MLFSLTLNPFHFTQPTNLPLLMASLPEFATAVIIIIAFMLAGYSAARELRPSDHGLVFQTSPPANSSLEMRSFFNNSKGSSSSGVSLRNATESLPPSWWTSTGGGGGRGGHLGRALMVASLVCGVTGGILLVASGLLYLFKNRKKQNQNDSFRADNNNNNNYNNNNANKLQLVRNL
ncbi:uncharacterized protein LOC133286303 [Gastrolobium bilobum]|uniref:uncharacterized protein LOC133286303 n=1 Tax=Gastrolobium bilobum TaxID=150636 RepID=UPI002AB13FC5|nr:uncharacterized protein LOC133286303 [Gastrolobium bilobum]